MENVNFKELNDCM